MRKICLILLCLAFLFPSASGAEVSEKYIALTFDDGPSGRFTRRLLEGLAQRDAHVTFFLCGYRLENAPEMAEEILAGGHEIGLHGYSHKNMQNMSRRDIAQELNDSLGLLPQGCPVRLFRPPGGCSSDGCNQVARAMKLSILDWSVDPRDWATQDTAAVGRSILDRVKDGDVVLLHDMTDSSVNAALNTIDLLQKQGFTFVTVSELARLRDLELKPGEHYRSFPAP